MLGDFFLFENKEDKTNIPLSPENLLLLCYLAIAEESDRTTPKLAEVFRVRSEKDEIGAFHKRIQRLKDDLCEVGFDRGLIKPKFYRAICDTDVDLFESNFRATNFKDALEQYKDDFLAGVEIIGCDSISFNRWASKQRDILKREKKYANLLRQVDLGAIEGGFQGAVEELARENYLGIDASNELVELVYIFFRVGRKSIEASEVRDKAVRNNRKLDLSFGRNEAKSKLLDRYKDFSIVKISRELDRVYRIPEIPNKYFSGRQEYLRELESSFNRSEGIVFPQVIYGLGGVGVFCPTPPKGIFANFFVAGTELSH